MRATIAPSRGNRLKEIEDRVKTLPLLKARRELPESPRRRRIRWRQRPRMSLKHLIMSQGSSTPRSEQSSIKSDEEQMVGLDEVTAATGDMTLDAPWDQEAPSHPDDDPGTQDEPQE